MNSFKHFSLALPFLLVALLSAALAADEKKDDKKDDTKKDETKTEKMAETEYYPLKIGTVWHYKLGETKFKLKAMQEEKISDKPTVLVVMLGEGDRPLSNENINVSKDGVFRMAFEGHKAEPPVEILKLPVKAGETWKIDSSIEKEKVKGTFTIGKEEKVKVPAGEYDAVPVSSKDLDAQNTKVEVTTYYAKKVGMVKQIIKISNQEVVIELEKYEEGK